MARINNNRKVRKLFDNRDSRNIKSVSCKCFVCADTSFAEHNLIVTACHNIFGTHEPFFDCCGKTSLEKDRLVNFAELLEKLKVLHISCTNLNNVNILEHINV